MKKFLKCIAAVCFVCFCFFIGAFAKGDSLENIKSRGYVKVSTNAEFEPFEYKDADKIKGIDIDIVKKIAEYLGVDVQINDVSFDAVTLEIKNKKCDLAISAMSYSEERAQNVSFSDSYYTSKQVIIVPNESEIKSEKDLHGKSIGVAMGFTGDIYCTQHYSDSKIERYSKSSDAVFDLLNSRLDAVVVDEVPARSLVNLSNNLCKILDGYCLFEEEYRIVVSKDEDELLNVVNETLHKMKETGEVEKIINSYVKNSQTPSVDFIGQIYNNLVYKDRYKMIFNGFLTTLEITSVALLIGITLGLVVSLIKISKSSSILFKFLKALANIYLTIIRGTPLVVQLFAIYYLILSATGLNKITIAMIAFGINSGAYVAEVIRSGILSVDAGQYEAGRSLGLNSFTTMKKIVLPQAFKNVLPTLVNEFIQLVKETSVAGFIGVTDLSRAGDIIRSQTYEPFVPLATVAVIYLAVVILTTFLMSFMERRLRASDKR